MREGGYAIKTVHEGSNLTGNAHISCTKYRNVKNISHFHSDIELIYVNRGRATVVVGENIFNLLEKYLVFVCSNEIHSITSEEGAVITVLKINASFYEKHFGKRILASLIVNDTMGFEEVLEDIASELRGNEEYRLLAADCAFIEYLIGLFRKKKTVERSGHANDRSSSHVMYNDICQKIANEYRTVTFKEMAEYMHFSEPYFSKAFRNIFGMTFTEYLNTVKIAVAIERVREGRMTVTEIASACGFNTIRNFNRVFKNLTGYSPNGLPSNYVFMYSLKNGYFLDPTLNCTEVLDG